MAEVNPFDEQNKKLPGFLNVLTILSFVGCGIQLISLPLTNWLMSFSTKMMENPDVVANMSEKDLADMEKGKRMFELMEQNTTALWIMTILAVALCVYGVMRMRKLKREGFFIYTIGELLPLIGGAIILGFSNMFTGASSYFFQIGLPLLFIGLYFKHLKYMEK